MKISQDGIRLMHHFESCKLTAYPDPGSANGEPWTVGWGSTGPDIRRGVVWTQAQADERFALDLGHFERDVAYLVKVPLQQCQFDALVSFAYNCGSDIDADTIAEGLGDSSLLKKLNAGDYQGAADGLLAWTKNDGKVMLGLRRRRAAERALFLGQDWLKAAEAVV